MRQVVVLTLAALMLSSLQPICLAESIKWYDRGNDAEFQGNDAEAVEDFKHSMQEESTYAPKAAVKLFDLYKALHRYDEAAQALNDVIRLSGNNSYAIELANLYRDSGRPYEAIHLYQDYLVHKPDDGAALLGLGISLEATAQYDSAREVFERILSGSSNSVSEARRHLARIKNADTDRIVIDNDSEIGIWPKQSMPLKVFIQDGSDVPGYRPEMSNWIHQAIAAWSGAALDRLSITTTDNQADANIVVSWVQFLPGALGKTLSETTEHALTTAHIYLSTQVDSQGKTLPPESPATEQLYEARNRMMREVALHELGHALGLKHSARTDDIMADGIFGLNAEDVQETRGLQPGDIARIQALYAGNRDTDAPVSAIFVQPAAPQPTISTVDAAQAASKRRIARGAAGTLPSELLRQSDLSIALFDISAGKYESSRDCLSSILNRNPSNAAAHYLMAITLVELRDYKEAASHYRQVLKLSPSGGSLSNRAADGLAKIAKSQLSN